MPFIPSCLTEEKLFKCEEYQTATAFELHKLFKFFTLASRGKATNLKDGTDAAKGGKDRQTVNAGISHNHMFILKTYQTFLEKVEFEI
jgi:uncharacterized Rmd1/YagE family protein